MVCKNCSHDIPDNSKFCINCGNAIAVDHADSDAQQGGEATVQSQPAPVVQPQMQQPQFQPQQNQYQYFNPQMQQPMMQPPAFDPNNIPAKYKPLSPWAYFWSSILFCIPVIGFIFLLIFTFGASNINLRNYARSYWCALLIALIIAAVIVVIGVSTAMSIF